MMHIHNVNNVIVYHYTKQLQMRKNMIVRKKTEGLAIQSATPYTHTKEHKHTKNTKKETKRRIINVSMSYCAATPVTLYYNIILYAFSSVVCQFGKS